jgi:hypothetical protein
MTYLQGISNPWHNKNHNFTCQRCGTVIPRKQITAHSLFEVVVTLRHYEDWRDHLCTARVTVCEACVEPFGPYLQAYGRLARRQEYLQEAEHVLIEVPEAQKQPVLNSLDDLVEEARVQYLREREAAEGVLLTWGPMLQTQLDRLPQVWEEALLLEHNPPLVGVAERMRRHHAAKAAAAEAKDEPYFRNDRTVPGQEPYTEAETRQLEQRVSEAAEGDPGEANEPRGED